LFDLNQMICIAMLMARMYNGCDCHPDISPARPGPNFTNTGVIDNFVDQGCKGIKCVCIRFSRIG
jgi:hypothetical protein